MEGEILDPKLVRIDKLNRANKKLVNILIFLAIAILILCVIAYFKYNFFQAQIKDMNLYRETNLSAAVNQTIKEMNFKFQTNLSETINQTKAETQAGMLVWLYQGEQRIRVGEDKFITCRCRDG